jgi:predicted alpha/beta-hydrolase family hydrolase
MATLVVGHGAGGGVGSHDLQALATDLPSHGITVVLVEQPWVLAGKKIAPAPSQLDPAWRQLLASLADVLPEVRDVPFVVSGRSAGARVACRTAPDVGADAVVASAFPLHPPGRPERSRAEELLAVQVPTLVVQGARDVFGTSRQLKAKCGGAADHRVVSVPGADHAFRVAKKSSTSQSKALSVLTRSVADFVLEVAAAS